MRLPLLASQTVGVSQRDRWKSVYGLGAPAERIVRERITDVLSAIQRLNDQMQGLEGRLTKEIGSVRADLTKEMSDFANHHLTPDACIVVPSVRETASAMSGIVASAATNVRMG